MDPDVWAVLSAVAAMMTLNNVLMLRFMRSEFKGLDAKFDSKIDALDAKFDAKIDALDAKIDNVDARAEARIHALAAVIQVQFGAIDQRLSAIEEDMLLVKAHLLGASRAS